MPKSVADYLMDVNTARKQKAQQEFAPLVGQIDILMEAKQKQAKVDEGRRYKLDVANTKSEAEQQQQQDDSALTSSVVDQMADWSGGDFITAMLKSGEINIKDAAKYRAVYKPHKDKADAAKVLKVYKELEKQGYTGTEPAKYLTLEGYDAEIAKSVGELWNTEDPSFIAINKTISDNEEAFANANTPADYRALIMALTDDNIDDKIIKIYTDALFNKSPQEQALEEKQIKNALSSGAIVADEPQFTDKWAEIDELEISREAKLGQIKAYLLTNEVTNERDLSNNMLIAESLLTSERPTEANETIMREVSSDVYVSFLEEDSKWTSHDIQGYYKARYKASKNVHGSYKQSGIDTLDNMLTAGGIAKLSAMEDKELRGYGLDQEMLRNQKFDRVLISQYMIEDLEMKDKLVSTDMKKASKELLEKWETSRTSYSPPTKENSTGGTNGN